MVSIRTSEKQQCVTKLKSGSGGVILHALDLLLFWVSLLKDGFMRIGGQFKTESRENIFDRHKPFTYAVLDAIAEILWPEVYLLSVPDVL